MKKTIKSTISLILALCILLVSMTACEKEEPDNEPFEEKNVPIGWNLTIEGGGQYFNEKWEEMPENFFDYWYAELPQNRNRTLKITLVFDYRYNFEDMPQDFQKQHNDFIQKYKRFYNSSASVEEYTSRNELRNRAYYIAYETAENYYKSFEFQSSISSNLNASVYWDNEIGFKYYEGNISFNFMYDTLYSYKSITYEASVFDTWEWHNRINELAKISGIKKVRVWIEEEPVGDCT